MKRQADRQNYFQEGYMIAQLVDIGYKEIIIFEYAQDAHIRDQAHTQQQLSFWPGCIFDQDACDIIYNNGKKKDQDINGDEGHVKYAAGDQQMEPSPFVWQQKKANGDDDEED
jgi:hypothetical protein